MKISSYSIVALPKLGDKLIGTSVDEDDPIDETYNFTLAELLELFQGNLNSNSIVINNIQEYSDNASALLGGLLIGQMYRTDDILKIVH